MSQQQPIDVPAHGGPKCPSCGGGHFSFSEIIGPVGHALRIRRELAELNKQFEAKGAMATQAPRTNEEEAYLHLADDPEQAESRLRQQRVEAVQREYAATKQETVRRIAGPSCKLALVHCLSCGHIVGAAELPEQREAAIVRLEHGLAELCQSITKMHTAVAGLLANVRGQLAAINAREEARTKAAQLNRAVSAAGQLLGGKE